MASLQSNYCKTIKKHFQKAPVWAPTEVVQLGQYGFYNDGNFVLRGNVFDGNTLKSEDFRTAPTTDRPIVNYLIKSEKSLSVETRAEGAGGEYEYSLEISFESESGFVAQFFNTASEEIYVGDPIRDRIAAMGERWDEDYRLVTGRIVADHVKFSYAQRKGAKIELGAISSDPDATMASLNLHIRRATDMNTDLWLGAGRATPMVEIVRYSRRTADFRPALALVASNVTTVDVADEPLFFPTLDDSFVAPPIGMELQD